MRGCVCLIAIIVATYPYRKTIFLSTVGKFHNKLWAGSFFTIVQWTKTTDDFNTILCWYLTFRRHFVRILFGWLAGVMMENDVVFRLQVQIPLFSTIANAKLFTYRYEKSAPFTSKCFYTFLGLFNNTCNTKFYTKENINLRRHI